MNRIGVIGWLGALMSLGLAGCAQGPEPEGATSGAYIVANFQVTDMEAYAAYPPLARPMLAAHGAEVLAVDRESEVLEGAAGSQTVVIRFPSKEAARAFYSSPEYREIVHLRTDNSDGFMVLIEGVAAAE